MDGRREKGKEGFPCTEDGVGNMTDAAKILYTAQLRIFIIAPKKV